LILINHWYAIQPEPYIETLGNKLQLIKNFDMRCIFCKKDSSKSKSIEHIIPESLGNTRYTLPQGVVCDNCNNYFSRKIEGKMLELPYFKSLRFRQDIKTKRRISPQGTGLVSTPGCEIKVQVQNSDRELVVHVNKKADFEKISNTIPGTLYVPIYDFPERDNQIISRFLGKVGLEELSSKFLSISEEALNEALIDNTQFDLLRSFVRYGKPDNDWPYYLRRIYSEDKLFQVDGGNCQKVHEEHLLLTEAGELYVVVCILGIEYTLNLIGPELDGYENWLKEHHNKSPLDENIVKKDRSTKF